MGRRYPSWRTFNSGQHAVDDEKPTTIDVGPKHPAERPQGDKSDRLRTALPREEDDRALIAECCAGHTQTFNRLILRHQNSVSILAIRLLRDPREAEDVTQDTFLRA